MFADKYWARFIDFLFKSGRCPFCKRWVRKVLYNCPYCRKELGQLWPEYKQMENKRRENLYH